jgi:hypothetical protein
MRAAMSFFLPLLVLSFVLGGSPALANSGGGGGGGPAGLPESVRIKPLMIPVITNGQVAHYNIYEVTLEVKNSMRLGEVQLSLPRLHDLVLSEFYAAIDKGWVIRGSLVNATALRRRINEAADEIMGKDLIGRVLITPTTRLSSWP